VKESDIFAQEGLLNSIVWKILSTLARSTAVNTLTGMLAENEHLSYVVSRAGEHK
jgi:hypothetical protein